MGGRRPTSPRIVAGDPPKSAGDFDRFIRTQPFPPGGPRDRRGRPAPSADGRGFRQPPPGYKYDEIDRLVPIDTPSIGGKPRGRRVVRSTGFPVGPRCPDPNMLILMANGSQKKAGDLKVGDLVKTYHEKDLENESKLARYKSLVLSSGDVEKDSYLREQLENSYAKATLGEYKVQFVDIVKNVEKIKLFFEGSEIVCSLTHKFYVNNSWKEAKDMVVGDEVSGKKLLSTQNVEDGDVVHITIEDAHTYICEGLLSHNKRRPPRGPRKPPRGPRRPPRGPRKPREPDFMSGGGGYDPKSGVRYTDRGVPTAVEQTRRVPVKDPTLGGPPEREVPIPKEIRQRITRESDPRGAAPFSPDEKGMARDRFFERMFDRADERKQQASMEREDMRETRRAMRDERRARRSEPGEINIDAERGGRRRRRRRGRRRDFTRRRSEMEGGRRGRSREERSAFRDRYVSTLR